MPFSGQEQAGTKQQEPVWEVGLWGGNILPELSAVATANPGAQGNGSCFLLQPLPAPAPSKTTAASQAAPAEPSALPEGSWGEAGGQTALGLLWPLPEQGTITDLPWLQPCVPGMGFGCAEPRPHLVAPGQPCCGSQGCSCCHIWLSPKCQRGWRCPRTSALGGVGSCSHPGAVGRDACPEIRSPTAAELPGTCPGFWGGAEPEDTWTRATGAACGARHPRVWAPGAAGRAPGPGILGMALRDGFRCRQDPGAMSEGSAAGSSPRVGADLPPAAPKSRTPGVTEPSAVTVCALPPALTVSRVPKAAFGHPKSPGSSRGRAPGRAQPFPVGCHGDNRGPRRICLASLLSQGSRPLLGRCPGRQEVRDGIGQGREQQERVCTGTRAGLSRDLAPPGPCPMGAREHGPALAPLLRVPGSPGAERGWSGDSGVREHREQRAMGAARTCLHKVPLSGESECTCRSWAKSRRRALAAPAELTHRPGSLPGASGSAAPPHGGSLSSGEKRAWGWGDVLWAARCRIGPSAMGPRTGEGCGCALGSVCVAPCPPCVPGGAGWPGLGAVRVTATPSTGQERG